MCGSVSVLFGNRGQSSIIWKWQAGRVGNVSKTHFSNVPTVLVIRAPNQAQGWRFFLISEPTLQGRGEKSKGREWGEGQAADSLYSHFRGKQNKTKRQGGGD